MVIMSRTSEFVQKNGWRTELLDLIRERPGITMQEVEAETGWPRNTTYHRLTSLYAYGLIGRQERMLTGAARWHYYAWASA